jgi:L,D-peptidoglycan transpeptidase YkuD (ErfK/YbiS/YcfS/YnhG family)
VGAWALLPGYYRADRGTRPVTGLALNPSRRGEAWCDNPHSCRYNMKIKVAETGAVESFWRGDAVYDVVFPTNHNTRPRIKGAGSAIFFHLTRAKGVATAGCVAVSAKDMRKILLRAGRKALIIVRPPEGWPLRAHQK